MLPNWLDAAHLNNGSVGGRGACACEITAVASLRASDIFIIQSYSCNMGLVFQTRLSAGVRWWLYIELSSSKKINIKVV